VATIPCRQEIETSWEETGLEQSQKETGGQDSRITPHESLANSDETEAKHATSEPQTRGEAFEEDVGRDLEDDVGDEENYQSCVILGALKIQVSRQAVDVCIGNIYAGGEISVW